MGRMNMGPPMYGEAFPCISIVELERRVKARRRICEFTDEHLRTTGFVQVHDLRQDRLVLTYLFRGTPNVEQADDGIEIALTRADRHVYRGRPSMICPRCGLAYEKLFYVSHDWACYICHDLTTISKVVKGNNPVKWMREYLRLRVECSFGRSKGQHEASYTKLVADRDRMADHYYSGWEAKEWHFMQVPRWPLTGGDVKLEPPPGVAGFGWTAGAEGGFQRLRWLHAHEQQTALPSLVRRDAAIRARLAKRRVEQELLAQKARKKAIRPVLDQLSYDPDSGTEDDTVRW